MVDSTIPKTIIISKVCHQLFSCAYNRDLGILSDTHDNCKPKYLRAMSKSHACQWVHPFVCVKYLFLGCEASKLTNHIGRTLKSYRVVCCTHNKINSLTKNIKWEDEIAKSSCNLVLSIYFSLLCAIPKRKVN